MSDMGNDEYQSTRKERSDPRRVWKVDAVFPSAAIRELREFFFVSAQFLEQGGEHHIFDSFDLSTPDAASQLMRQGFRPYLLCLNEDRTNLWCHSVLHKEDDGWDRIICADAGAYFASAAGGYEDIMTLFESLIRQDLTYVMSSYRKSIAQRGTRSKAEFSNVRGWEEACAVRILRRKKN
jgi:hypothetical protein